MSYFFTVSFLQLYRINPKIGMTNKLFTFASTQQWGENYDMYLCHSLVIVLELQSWSFLRCFFQITTVKIHCWSILCVLVQQVIEEYSFFRIFSDHTGTPIKQICNLIGRSQCIYINIINFNFAKLRHIFWIASRVYWKI